jgi:ergothioneine biosynthesis protein EgtB
MSVVDPATRAASPSLSHRFRAIRARTVALAAPLSADDACAQSMPDASPAKWHLAHTTWFFEQFVLGADPAYRPWRDGWQRLFNSYYEAVGDRVPRAERGLITRPGLAEVLEYRHEIDQRVAARLAAADDPAWRAVVELGLQHEQQHQELLLTDIKHLLSRNPLDPVYQSDDGDAGAGQAAAVPLQWIPGAVGPARIGHPGEGFAFDCERPRHDVLLAPHAVASRPVNNAEYLEFVREGGYRTPALWLSEGWDAVQRHGWRAPLYWSEDGASEFTLAGRRPLEPLAPVCHLSFFEADAFARFAGARLPTEAEWEVLAAAQPAGAIVQAHWADADRYRPRPPVPGAGARQLFGDVWEWTGSPYVGYPGYRPAAGAIGEYNGKFMSGQWVLRGGSCASPAGHLRASYRNFFHPHQRWQFSGLRLARDA